MSFVDSHSNITIHADLDRTVIHATLRPQDLIPAFLNVLKDTPEYEQLVANNAVFPSYAQEDDDSEWWNSEDCAILNEELFNVLNQYAPEGYYFGSHQGDGSDFGYWKEED